MLAFAGNRLYIRPMAWGRKTAPTGAAGPGAQDRAGRSRRPGAGARLQLSDRLRHPWRTSPLWFAALRRRSDKKRILNGQVPPVWPGDSDIGELLLDGYLTFGGETRELTEETWLPEDTGADWLQSLHRFGWLADLRAVGNQPHNSQDARRAAAAMILSWIAQNRRWHPDIWRADVVADRICAWMIHRSYYAAALPPHQQRQLTDSIARQARYLARQRNRHPAGAGEVTIAKGLILTGICLSGSDSWFDMGEEKLITALTRQVLPDGGHIERAPGRILRLLRDLAEIRAAYFDADIEPPEILGPATEQLSAALKFFVLPDGQLAHFNSTSGLSADGLETIFRRTGDFQHPDSLPYTGFQRLNARRSVLIADAGPPPAAPYDRFAHAGSLSFEFALGKQRLIVNCGSHIKARYSAAARLTAAHSTLIAGDRNSTEVKPDGHIGTRRAAVRIARAEQDSRQLLQMSHGGYDTIGGGEHIRLLQLEEDGELLEGEDRFTTAELYPVQLRFHLHPDIKARGQGDIILLRLPQGRGWEFQVSGGQATVEPSIYFDGHRAQRCQQIVVTMVPQAGNAPGEVVAHWTLAREGRAARAAL